MNNLFDKDRVNTRRDVVAPKAHVSTDGFVDLKLPPLIPNYRAAIVPGAAGVRGPSLGSREAFGCEYHGQAKHKGVTLLRQAEHLYLKLSEAARCGTVLSVEMRQSRLVIDPTVSLGNDTTTYQYCYS